MSDLFGSGIGQWLQLNDEAEGNVYRLAFNERHLGNIWIRSIHGGVSAATIEACAEIETRKVVGADTDVLISSSNVDYLRITKDADIFARANIERKSRRLSIVDVVCWQDSEDIPVVRGTVTLKLQDNS